MARKKARKKSGRKSSGRKKAARRSSGRRKTTAKRGKGKVPLKILEKRLKKMNSIVKTRKGKAYNCAA